MGLKKTGQILSSK